MSHADLDARASRRRAAPPPDDDLVEARAATARHRLVQLRVMGVERPSGLLNGILYDMEALERRRGAARRDQSDPSPLVTFGR